MAAGQDVVELRGGLLVGAGVPLADLGPFLEGKYPALASALSLFASRQIRNLATLGGNVGTASSIGDASPVLIAYGASVILRSVRGSREVPLDGFFTGYRKTLREPDEIILALRIPPPDGAFIRSYKVSKRRDLDIATLSACFRLSTGDGGGVESGKTVAGIRPAGIADAFRGSGRRHGPCEKGHRQNSAARSTCRP